MQYVAVNASFYKSCPKQFHNLTMKLNILLTRIGLLTFQPLLSILINHNIEATFQHTLYVMYVLYCIVCINQGWAGCFITVKLLGDLTVSEWI